ncbi:MAG: outer membrane beta-barrel protein [Bacteroidales bacterium]|nr:outer membrane beta-barrel protein [Bacteroidales bacterium]
MIKENKNIDKLFNNTLHDYEPEVPNHIWDNIKENLVYKKKRSRIILFQRIAASVAILMAFGAGYFLTDLNNKKTQLAEQVIIVNKENELDINTDDKNNSSKNLINPENKTEPETLFDNTDITLPEDNDDKISNEPIYTDKPILNTNIDSDEVEKNITGTNENLFAEAINEDETNINLSADRQDDSELIAISPKYLIDNKTYEVDIKYPDKIEFPYVYYMDETQEKDKNENRFIIAGQFSPLYAFRNVSDVNENTAYKTLSSNNNEQYKNENALISYAGGINLQYQLSKRINIQSGVYYSEIGQVTKNVNITNDNNMYLADYTTPTSAGDIETDFSSIEILNSLDEKENETDVYRIAGNNEMSVNSDFIQNFEYIEIPFIVRYKLIDRKIGLNILGGLSTNILVGNKAFIEYDNEKYKIGETNDINPLGYSSTLGMGIVYVLSKKISVSMEPTFRYALKSISKNNSYYPYSYAVFTGISYSF